MEHNRLYELCQMVTRYFDDCLYRKVKDEEAERATDGNYTFLEAVGGELHELTSSNPFN